MPVAPPQKRWRIAESERGDVKELADSANIPPIVAQLLLQRGLCNVDTAHNFLTPTLAQLSDPMLLTDMDRAVERITTAKEKREHVQVFGDYDVDGISATALMTSGLRRYGIERVSHGMPLRLSEGYGLGPDHVDTAHADGVSLIITVDNGIASLDAAARAKELGVDLIITDHHSIENGLPEACAVINPQRETPDHPCAKLCGAGVAFKLSTALNGTANDLDIAALGTVADIVPLVGENRVIVALGLRHMAQHQRNGIAKLAEAAGLKVETLSSENIGFQLGPRINAAGRLDDGLVALELLMSTCPDEAREIARALNDANDARRQIEKAIYDEATEELEAFLRDEQRGIVLARRGWHAGVIGIVASRIQARYARPTVLIAIDEDGTGRGSARAGADFDMVGAFATCQQYLEQFGGHRAAAGLTILEENVDTFRAAFEIEAQRQLGTGELSPELAIDAVAAFSEIDSALLNALEHMEPFGHSNPSPIFASFGVEIPPGGIRVLKDQHLKVTLKQDGRSISAIGFGMAERYYRDGLGDKVDIAYTPQFNTWRGETSIQLLLRDIRNAEK